MISNIYWFSNVSNFKKKIKKNSQFWNIFILQNNLSSPHSPLTFFNRSRNNKISLNNFAPTSPQQEKKFFIGRTSKFEHKMWKILFQLLFACSCSKIRFKKKYFLRFISRLWEYKISTKDGKSSGTMLASEFFFSLSSSNMGWNQGSRGMLRWWKIVITNVCAV